MTLSPFVVKVNPDLATWWKEAVVKGNHSNCDFVMEALIEYVTPAGSAQRSKQL